MREVPSSVAKAYLSKLLTEVEGGTTLVITRYGRAVARLESIPAKTSDEVRRTMEQIARFRRTMPSLTLPDILSSRHEDHRI